MKTKTTKPGRSLYLFLFIIIMGIAGPIFAQTSHIVNVTNNVFTPKDLVIAQGDTVIWNCTQGNHNVNGSQSTYPSNPESFKNNVGSGWSFSHVFTIPGKNDYQCDPHVGFGMVGTISVEEAPVYSLTINFSGMTPHVGQDLWLLVRDKNSGANIYRDKSVVAESFSVEVNGIETGHSYEIEFYADHNQNGMYDGISTDHAWKLELENVEGDESIDFVHNTNFSEIEWEHMVILNLSGMTPHVGQEIYFALIEVGSGEIVDRESETVTESFSVMLENIEPGKDYRIDFFSDHNDNGLYDAPSDDHAWRIEFTAEAGDKSLDFVHNTNFTDIEWKYRLKVKFSGMNPHVGQHLTLYLKDIAGGLVVDTVEIDIQDADFDLESYAIEPGKSYNVDFFSDHNGNGSYDAPPTDHAWRLVTSTIEGDTELEFTHNTNFTDIGGVTSSRSETLDENKLSVFPNPVLNRVTIKSSTEISSIEIINLSGRIVRTVKGYNTSSLEVRMDDLKAGIYFLRIVSQENQVESIRLVKN